MPSLLTGPEHSYTTERQGQQPNGVVSMPDLKIKIGLTRGLVDGGEIFAQFSLSSSAHFQHLLTYISAICAREKVLAVYWFNRHDREFVLIHDDGSMDQCLAQSGLHEILYVITESFNKLHGYNSVKHPSEHPTISEANQLKTSSPSSGPSPDTANLERSSDDDRRGQAVDPRGQAVDPQSVSIPLRKMSQMSVKKSPSLEWNYDVMEPPPSIQEVSSREESAFDMTSRGERPTYYPYLEHYQPAYPTRPKPHRSPARTKRPEPKHNPHKYSTHSEGSDDGGGGGGGKEDDTFLEQEEPPKRKKKAKRRANRAALEQKRQEIEMESFQEFASTVTADYLAEMFSKPTNETKASNGRRLIWVLIWTASFVYAWYNIALSIGIFISKPTATKLNFYEAPTEGVPFPTVTICNFNRFNKSYFDADTNAPRINKQLKEFLRATTPIWGHKEELTEKNWNELYGDIDVLSIKDVLRDAAHSLEDTVEFCKFSGSPCRSATNPDEGLEEGIEPEPATAFQKIFTEHGMCYSFNLNGKLNMSRTGALYGLSLRLHVAQDDYFDIQDVAGFKVLLHSWYEPPMIEEYGFALRPGSESYVRIRLEKYKDTPRPLGYCSPYLEQQFTQRYTISKCIMAHRARYMLAKCGCISFYMILEGSNPQICNLKQERTCAEKVLEDIALRQLKIGNKTIADPDCPNPCAYTTYTYTISQSEYPSSSVTDRIVEEVNKQKGGGGGEGAEPWDIGRIRDNYLKVHIYFEELSTLEMERHPSYLISNLIGDVGGQLGLLLGMNICSLVQFTDYILRFSFFSGFMRLIGLYKAKKQAKKRAFVND